MMHPVTAALVQAFNDLRQPRIMVLVLVPPFATLAVWGALAWAFAGDWARLVADWIAGAPWLGWVGSLGLSWIFIWASGIAAAALLLPIVLITALVVTELVAMPVIVPWVGIHHFPRLEPRRGGTVAGSVANAAVAIAVFAVLWLITLPLWLTGIGALLAPLLVSAHFNQRMFRYDALAEHATAAEYASIVARARGRLFALGVLLGALYWVPFVNLAAPVLGALAFTHLCLNELARLRHEVE
jgi:CysZ protein